ncbi:hypothetical protein [Xanthomonas translucens]|uniref:Phage RecA-dependent nuclease n=2 Tax=Xanthomonas campestris pv. translucens TaxID=343 RepID=A0A109HRX9_XANCT|nr:hypothetical protein [Xanthomonas translucens]KWV17155.1 hypothetical protein ATB53_00300 [Xanthomonas translucens]QSQ34688.1 hypothetical protein ISN31_03420 [Xanthomonas translucens pv. translucens]
MKRAIKPATRAEQAYQDAARALGCVVCRWRFAAGLQRGIGCGHVRIHHRNVGDLHGQKQIGQHAVVAMGDWHHQGIPMPGKNGRAMYAIYGPSFQEQAREFRMWTLDVLGGRGTEAWQDYQDQLLNITRAA